MDKIKFDDLNLNKSLLKALDDLGLQYPTTIQHKIFSVIMSGRDVCGIAQTGTGKTYAYLLPCLRLWNFSKDKQPQVLILVPTRELVMQVVEEVKKLCAYLSVEVVGVYGGVNMKPQALAVENGCDVVVATPGRLLDLVLDGSLKLKGIKRLVIDEMDEMMNLGFRVQLTRILDLLPARRQNLMFSATITDEVELLMNEYFTAPERVEAAPAGTPLANIDQSVYRVPNFYTKVNLLTLLLEQNANMSRVLVFVATKSLADQLYEELESKFAEIMGVMHSNKSQNYRFNTVNKFQSGEFRFIIATDIIARGLDITEVSHVINFDVPEEPEAYIHRIGRTGRADKKGIAISFVTEKEQEFFAQIEALMNYTVPVQELPEGLEISDMLTDDEKPKVRMKEVLIKLPDIRESKGAFHEKLAKNKKVNIKISHKDKMMEKYGKPKTRGAKKK
ncbi:MAG: box helicase [Flavipsychrobacter sp.]|jgi:ATP-dependent RNA helicase RhlE|nr:box helicase [Flavipsychrobacter sp.]